MDALTRWLGPGRLADLDPPVLLTAYDIQARQRCCCARDSSDVTMIDAAHASSAAPSYFEPVRIGDATLVDGGVFATNPAVCAYAQVGGKLDLLLSLGTGEHTRPLPYDEGADWGQLEWARPILDVVFDGTADAVDIQLTGCSPAATCACRRGSTRRATTSTTRAPRTSPPSGARPSA